MNQAADRARAMKERVLREAREFGIAGEGLELVAEALERGFAPRVAALSDDHDPALLHPGRSLLILLGDTPERSPERLATAALIDSVDPRFPPVTAGLEGVADILARAPLLGPEDRGDEDTRLEVLVTAPAELTRLVLAERLDHLRHLHLSPDMELRLRLHGEASRILAPVAERVDPVLGRRYRWWCRMFVGHLPEVS